LRILAACPMRSASVPWDSGYNIGCGTVPKPAELACGQP
jgi:hypothetical protein